ncbi:hypothetical protein AB751O23_DI_00030 [Chlamydiales bacterium SCGC AB-751-O23]|jgi:predicted Zn-dependent protease|nr:hypothetical protein AB751O23_DI_00030 [Chlamydiales bacterium SCGC AB-751-O23]
MDSKIINWQEVLGWGKDQVDDIKFFAFSYLKQGKYEIALKLFLGLKVLVPEDSYVIKTLGSLYLVTNQPEIALEYLNRSTEIEPKNSRVKLNIVQALLDSGQREEAIKKAKSLVKVREKAIAGKAKALIMAWG